MQNYGYMGAQWANQATAARNNAQQWGQYGANNANQASQLRVGQNQLQSQIGMNTMRQRDGQFRFGLQALGGLLQ